MPELSPHSTASPPPASDETLPHDAAAAGDLSSAPADAARVAAITERFDREPVAAALEEMQRCLHELALEGFAGTVHQRRLRLLAAFDRLRCMARNADVVDFAETRADGEINAIARSRAGKPKEVEAKLAAAIYLALHSDTDGTQLVLLLAGTLADLVTMRGGPIRLPRRSTEAEIDVEHWRARAIERSRRGSASP